MEEKKIEKFAVEICVGDEVEIGRFHLSNQKITAITLDKWGHPVIETSGGRKTGIFAKRLKKLIPEDVERKVDEKEYKEE
jgi:hypothetical protein|tara:strand:+ start:378 stop:617 length:240 start_codon:yes stop_codon:yes gene_type:complete